MTNQECLEKLEEVKIEHNKLVKQEIDRHNARLLMLLSDYEKEKHRIKNILCASS